VNASGPVTAASPADCRTGPSYRPRQARLSGRAELVRYAMENGIVVPEKRGDRQVETDNDFLV